MALIAAFVYGHPSEKMVVIGVTGTKGKSTTCNIIWQVLTTAGNKVGMTTTVNFRIGEKEWLNDYKMTMVGRFKLQKLLKEMVEAGCSHAVIETSSEGIMQSRHLGINYDMAVFTNLTPEHIRAHGSFDNYKNEKKKLFENISKKEKVIDGKKIEKIIVVNLDNEYVEYFLNHAADKKVKYYKKQLSDIKINKNGLEFKYKDVDFKSKLIGGFNLYNILCAISVGEALNIDLEILEKGVEKIQGVPGRMELIDEGQDFYVIVDYAYEPVSYKKVLEIIKNLYLEDHKLIALTGSCGGGRDTDIMPKKGKLAGQYADHVIITNEDPYDDDPQKIIDLVASGVEDKNKLFKISDREEGIKKAISLAKTGDVVLISGKGAEQKMALANGKYIDWDDREIARKYLTKK
ncbi:MAG: UDP-N-acetylmuramoyl-L-alanyl-D-glutamate--2,6-diaminopimelate ligase [Patescibacteria group bacterium]